MTLEINILLPRLKKLASINYACQEIWWLNKYDSDFKYSSYFDWVKFLARTKRRSTQP